MSTHHASSYASLDSKRWTSLYKKHVGERLAGAKLMADAYNHMLKDNHVREEERMVAVASTGGFGITRYNKNKKGATTKDS